jgi:general stress protein 26
MKTDSKQTKHLRDLMAGFSTAMLITRTVDDDLHARPMAVAGLDDSLDLWFVSGEGVKVDEIVHDTRAHVVCQKDHSAYLSLSGTAKVIRDRNKVEDLWKESFRVWFPDGKDDPNLILIHFHPEKAEFWDNTGFNKIAYLWKSAKAYVTGKQPEVSEEEHGVVTLN